MDGNWTLRVNGEPYSILGAGGEKHLDKLVECGGNTYGDIGNVSTVLKDGDFTGPYVITK